MRRYTLDEIKAFRPCEDWAGDDGECAPVRALLDSYGLESVTALDVLLASEVTDANAVWLASRMMTTDQRSAAAWVMADEAQASAYAAAAATTAAYAYADDAYDAAAYAADAYAYDAYAYDAAYDAAYAAAYAAYASDAAVSAYARKRSWRVAREVFAKCCQGVDE